MSDDNNDPLAIFRQAMEIEKQQPETIPEIDADGEPQRNVAATLVQIAQRNFEFVVDDDGTPFVDLEVGKVRKTLPLVSEAFDNEMRRRYATTTNGGIARTESIKAAREYLAAEAETNAPCIKSAMRTTKHNDKIYIDLCDDQWRVIEIAADGWRVVDRVDGLRFRRTNAMNPLPMPVAGGSMDDLKRLINCQSDDGFIMIMLWLLAAINGGPYQILAISGPDGATKSTTTTLVGDIIDPSKFPRKLPPKNDEDYIINCLNEFVQRYDNISKLTGDALDNICALATGAAMSTRKKYTDVGLAQFKGKAPFILNGIPNLAERRDVAARALPLILVPPTEEQRKTEADVAALFADLHPRLLGLLCEVASKGLAKLPHLMPVKLPRMADNAKWFMACADAFIEGGQDRLAEIMMEMDDTLAASNIGSDTFACVLITVLRDKQIAAKNVPADHQLAKHELVKRAMGEGHRFEWRVQGKDLYKAISDVVAEVNRGSEGTGDRIDSKSVPQASNKIRNYLDRVVTALAKAGISVGIKAANGVTDFVFEWVEADKYGVAFDF